MLVWHEIPFGMFCAVRAGTARAFFVSVFAAMRLACEMPRRAAIVGGVVALKAAPQRVLTNAGLKRVRICG